MIQTLLSYTYVVTMKFIEAFLSLIVLSLIASVVLSIHITPHVPTVYYMQVADDIWHILLLKYDGVPGLASPDHAKAEEDLNKIGEMTGMCIYVGGIRTTNCRGTKGSTLVSIHRKYLDTSKGVPIIKDITITLKHQ